MDNAPSQIASKLSMHKNAGIATDLVLNTAIGGIGGNLLGQTAGGAAGLGGAKSAIIGTLVGASSGTLATILDYIQKKKQDRRYYILDDSYNKSAGLGRDLLYNIAVGSFGGGLLGDALGDFITYNPYVSDSMSGGTLGALIGSGAGAIVAVRDYLRNKRAENRDKNQTLNN